MRHSELFKVSKPLKLLSIDKLERERIEVNIAVDIVVDVLGEPEVLAGTQTVYRGQQNAVVAVSPHW